MSISSVAHGLKHALAAMAITLMASGEVSQTAFAKPALAATQQFSWSESKIAPNRSFADARPALQIDTHGRAHLALAGDWLHYARIEGGKVMTAAVDAAPGIVAGVALALDSEQQPVISYVNITHRQLKSARLRNGEWRIEILDTNVSFGASAIAVDASGKARVAYIGYAGSHSMEARLARQLDAGWSLVSTPLAPPPTSFTPDVCVPRGIALIVISANLSHIALGSSCYSDFVSGSSQEESHHAVVSHSGANWNIRAWQPGALAGLTLNGSTQPAAIAVDALGSPPIAAVANDRNGHAHFATNETPAGSLFYAGCLSCTLSYPEATGQVEQMASSASLAVGANGAPHLAYLKDDAIVYSQWFGNGWLRVQVARGLSDVRDVQGAFGASGQPFAMYINAGNVLRMARRDADTWTDTVIDNHVASAAIATTRAGTPALAYMSARSGRALLYASLTDLGWITETVASDMSIGGATVITRLMLDTADAPHIIVIDRANARPIRHAWRTAGVWKTRELDVNAPASNSADAWLMRAADGTSYLAYTNAFESNGVSAAVVFRLWRDEQWQEGSFYGFASSQIRAVVMGPDSLPRIVYDNVSPSQSGCWHATWRATGWSVFEAGTAYCGPVATAVGKDNAITFVTYASESQPVVKLYRGQRSEFVSDTIAAVNGSPRLWTGIDSRGRQHVFVYDALGAGLTAYVGTPPGRVLLPYVKR